MDNEEIQRLKKLILKSGFPLEIKVASTIPKALAELGMNVQLIVSTSPYYLDKDEGKARELDSKIESMILSENNRPSVYLNLLIQCKNIPGNTWVFYKSPQPLFYFPKSTGVLDTLNWPVRWHADYTMTDLHMKNVPMTTVYSEFVTDKKRSNDKNNNLFEAIISLVKATAFDVEGDNAHFKKSVDTESFEHLSHVNIYYALVVFNGEMFLADEVDKGENMQLTPVNHVGCYVDYVSGSYDIDLLVEVIHESALETYVQQLKKDIDTLRSATDGAIGLKYMTEVLRAEKWFRNRGTLKE